MPLRVSVISVVSIICFLVASLIHSTTPLFYQAHFCRTANLTTEPLQTLTEIICRQPRLTQLHAGFTRGSLADFQISTSFSANVFMAKKKFNFFISDRSRSGKFPKFVPHWKANSEPRRDQRAFLLPSPAAGRPCAPHDRAGSVRNKARSSRAAFLMPNDRRAFRLRFGDGRFAPAPFLRLCACAPLTRSPNRRPKPRS